jgi:hypothetical protein
VSEDPVDDDVATGLAFLRAIRQDPALKARVDALDPEEGLEPVLALAAEAGFALSGTALHRAHRMDWLLRRARYA